MDALGSRSSFLSILRSVWEVSWESFWEAFWDLSMIWVPSWETVSRSMFLMIKRWKWRQNLVAVCVITSVKTMVFEGCHFFHVFTILVSTGTILGVILMAFGDLGHTFSDLWVYSEQAWKLMVFQGFPGSPQILRTCPVEGNGAFQLGSKQVT